MFVRVLGPFEVEGDDGLISVAGASQRAVLALLALRAGQPVGVSELIDALWPEDPPRSARNTLQSHVARLRARLGTPTLITHEPAGYCLHVPRETVDALRFESLLRAGGNGAGGNGPGGNGAGGNGPGGNKLGGNGSGADAEAVSLWRGVPLPEFPGEPFRGIAARLTTLYRHALIRHVRTLDPTLAADRLREAADADPCWEDGAVEMATALAAAGCRGEALDTLRRHCDAVIERLGLDPSERVRGAQQSLLRDRPPPPPAPVARDLALRVPLRYSSFLGRESERRQLELLLDEPDPGLVSVVGPGGVGKTRLVAETVRARPGVAWVDAADVREADFLHAVAVGVGARMAPHDVPLAVIAEAAARHPVVVLDNCEHVLEVAAELAEALRGVRVVVTSQESLRADGERVLRLGPLSPEAAGRLFCERARVPSSGAVGEIVERLDLMPLAIELAAVQAGALGVDELVARLDDRLDLLDRGRRGADPRHRTLRAVVEWSFALLDDASARLLRRLSVFAGGFTVAAAEAVTADEWLPRSRIAGLLAGLVDRSLVVRHGAGRFRLLETVRAYALEQAGAGLAAGPVRHAAAEFSGTLQRHATAMAAAAEELDARMRGADQASAVRDIDALLPDLRLAHARGDAAVRIRLAAAMYRYGYRCQQYEVLAWGRAVEADAPDVPAAVRADALAAAATHAWGRGDLAEARRLATAADPPGAPAHEVLGDVALVECDAETALTHYRAMGGEPLARVSGMTGEALVLAWSGRGAAAVAVASAAVELADGTGNPGARAEARYGLGEALGDLDPEAALTLLAEAETLAGTVDDRLFQAASGSAAVAIRSRHGDPAVALAAFRDVLRLWRRAGNDTLRAAALRNLVVLLARVGEDETAVLLDAALPRAAVYPAEAARLDRARAAAAERLGAGRVAEVARRGAMLGAARVTEEAARAIDAALARVRHR
ncbi:putative AfsR-family transcriptional regulator [Actinoplanes missouriensis 431]|uniref:Putative AfsR-family transcriptional regulator n=1 Tax=Actinoplanes missouriensis (strain ATCC 14538 / DSM 43046 / CBS 188.64 / JCM 3121 / NBRC 102363 / NCIMB 12654 / NRRL B-3342 / UNCC 431) TaxID=512565 RepID=I0HFK2_ACTM4|nr:winged helix-turn-helix domain-containing protein [Actinoplanes missouriensis]BAL91789.1 putative AfsR-family transcriptional regulator [Actinoplanes missouriensis 431]